MYNPLFQYNIAGYDFICFMSLTFTDYHTVVLSSMLKLNNQDYDQSFIPVYIYTYLIIMMGH